MQPSRIGDVSFWYADLGGLPQKRPPLDGDTTVDVCIIGAGYTGLWSAWYLKQADPALRIPACIKVDSDTGVYIGGDNTPILGSQVAFDNTTAMLPGSPKSVQAAIEAVASGSSTGQ
jgi:hypothetical protein